MVKSKIPGLKVLLLFVSLCLWLCALLLGLEIYFRYQLYRVEKNNTLVIADIRKYTALSEAASSSLWKVPWYEYKKNVGFKAKINNLDFQIRMNRYGFRTKDIAIPKPKGTYRIVCIGGSATVEGLTNDTTYPALLEKKLNTYFNSNRIEVLNCGISGIGAPHEWQKMPLYLQMEPDMLLEYNFVNDLCLGLLPRWWQKRPLWKRILTKSLFLADMFPGYLIISKKDAEKDINSYIISSLEAISAAASQHNVKVVFCSFASPDIARLNKEEREYFHYTIRHFWKAKISLKAYSDFVAIYNACLEQLCKKHGLQFIAVGKYLSGGSDYFVDIAHLTTKGIEKKADIIFNHLKSSLTLR